MDIQKNKKIPSLSVIVPVYNQENRIENLISDCLHQQFAEFELLIVNDGSTDATAVVCEKWAQKDARIQVFSIENAGPANARTVGLEHARGEYVFFADADDFIPPNSFGRIIQVAETKRNPDIVRGAFYIRQANKTQQNVCPWSEGFVSKNGKKDEIKRYHQLKNSSPFGYMWGAIYKREYLINSEISMGDLKLDFMEDTVFNLELFTLNPTYYICNEPVYGYVIQENSLSTNAVRDFQKSVLSVASAYGEFLEKNHCYLENLDNYAPLVARCFCYALVKTQMQKKRTISELETWIAMFASDEYVKKMLWTEGMIPAIHTISKIPERIFYSYCMKRLKKERFRGLAILFWGLIGPMNLYIKLSMKH